MRWSKVLRFGLPGLLAIVTVLAVGLGLALKLGWVVPPTVLRNPTLSRDFPELPFSGTPNFDLDLPPGPNPFPKDGESRKRADYLQLKERFRRRVVGEYERLTEDTGDVKKAGMAFLETHARMRAGGPGAPDSRSVTQLGNDLLAKGTQDPLLRAYCLGMAIRIEGRDDLQSQLVTAVRDLDASGYSTQPKFHAHRYVRWSADPADSTSQLREATVEMLREYRESPDLDRVLWEDLEAAYDTLDSFERNQLVADSRDVIQSPWLLHMLMGHHYDRVAWDIRGVETADTVQPVQWEQFAEYETKASLNFRRAWQLQPNSPEAPSRMIGIAMAGDEELSPREWFDRTIRAEVDYLPAYGALSWSQRPRWGGSTEAMLAFGRECAASKLYDTEAPAFLLDMILHLTDEGEDHFKDEDLINELLETLGHMARQSPQPGYWLSYTVAVAARTGRLVEGRQALDELANRNLSLDPAPFRLLGSSYPVQPARIFAYTGSAKGLVEEFGGNIFKRWKTPEATRAALERLQVARTQANDPRTAPYFDSVEQVLKWLDTFYRGDWVELTFDNPDAWNVSATSWRVESPKSIIISNRADQNSVQFYPRVIFTDPYVLECDFEPVPPGCHEIAGSAVGDLETGTGQNFFVDTLRGRVGVFTYAQRLQYLDVPEIKGKTAHLRLSIWEDQTHFQANGITINESPSPIRSEGKLMFGTPKRMLDRGTTRFSNLRVRRLPYGPPPQDDVDHDTKLRYYEQAVALFPDDPRNVAQLGFVHYEQKRYKRAIENMARSLALGNQERPDVVTRTLLGLSYQNVGRYEEAIQHFQAILDSGNSEHWPSHFGLAWIYATAQDDQVRNAKMALEHARQCVAVTRRQEPNAMAALAAAHGENGNYEQGITIIQELYENEETLNKNPAIREWCDAMLQQFQAGQPYRSEPAAE